MNPDAPPGGGSDSQGSGSDSSLPTCGGAGQTCCASNMCSAGLACTATDQVCRSAEMWIIGSNGTDAATATAVVLHGDGTSFTLTPLGTGIPSAIWGTSKSDVWVVFLGPGTTTVPQATWLRHWDGTAWSPQVDFQSYHYGIWGDAPTNYWMINNSGGARHWTGTSWSQPEPIITMSNNQVLSQIWGSSATSLWAISGNQVARGNGAGVWNVTTRSDFAAYGKGISGRSTGEMFSGGSDPNGEKPRVLSWDGSQFSVDVLGGATDCGAIGAMWAGPDDVWALNPTARDPSGMTALCLDGIPTLFRRVNSGTWTPQGAIPNSAGGTHLWGTSNRDLYVTGKATGGAPALFHYDGASWTTPSTPSGVTQIRGIWGTGQPK
jgi:hypothetical protein